MERKLLELQIEHLLQNIKFRMDTIRRQDDHIPRLDLDGLKDKVRELYDQVLMLEIYSSGRIKKVSGLYDSSGKEEKNRLSAGDRSTNIPDSTTERSDGDERSGRKTPSSGVQPRVEKEPHVKTNGKKTPSKRNIDDIQEKKKTLADKYLKEDDRSVAAKIKRNPIDDMKLAIGVNDKFLLIKELFGGNIQEYTEAIDQLNSFQTFEEAAACLKSLAARYEWKDDSEHYIRLSEIVERKYL
ncbi:MAG: hypothetical protein R6T99_02750 [Bacteroidales bacterium]